MKDKLFDALFGDGGLLRVRAAIALIMTGCFAYLVIEGETPADWFLAIGAPTIAYYFAQRGAA